MPYGMAGVIEIGFSTNVRGFNVEHSQIVIMSQDGTENKPVAIYPTQDSSLNISPELKKLEMLMGGRHY